MGHQITTDEKEFINELILFYYFNKTRLIIDTFLFLLVSFFMFYFIILFQN